jgi:4-alpha-glucanotransferase
MSRRCPAVTASATWEIQRICRVPGSVPAENLAGVAAGSDRIRDSPNQLFSAFAGNPLLIVLYTLRERGLLSSQNLDSASGLPDDHVEYGRVIDLKQDLIHRAARTFLADGTHADREAFDVFCQDNADWLDDYSLFMACKGVCTDAVWADWGLGIRQRDSSVLGEWRRNRSAEIEIHKFAQFEFFGQWQKLKTHCQRCVG